MYIYRGAPPGCDVATGFYRPIFVHEIIITKMSAMQDFDVAKSIYRLVFVHQITINKTSAMQDAGF